MTAPNQQSEYLASQIMTAPPHKVHLALISGAIRFGQQAQQAMQRGDHAAAATPLMRVIDILGEMVASVRGQKSELNKKLADLYWFLFRRATSAKINSDATALAEVLRLLEYERQTWQLVCDKFGDTASVAAPQFAKTLPAMPDNARTNGLSLEA